MSTSVRTLEIKLFELKEKTLKLVLDNGEMETPLENISSVALRESVYSTINLKFIGSILFVLAFISLLPVLLFFPLLVGVSIIGHSSETLGIIMYFFPSVLAIILFYISFDLLFGEDKLTRKKVKNYRILGIIFLVGLIIGFPLLIYPVYSAYGAILFASFLALRNLEYKLNLTILLPNRDIIITGEEKTLRELYEKIRERF